MNKNGVLDGITMLPKRWDSVIEKQGDFIEGLLFRSSEIWNQRANSVKTVWSGPESGLLKEGTDRMCEGCQ